MKEEVLLITHKKNETILSGLKKLRDNLGLNRKLKVLSQDIKLNISGVNEYTFSLDDLTRLGYPMMGNSIVPGNVHFILLMYYNSQVLKSDYYWVMEYDVRYNGSWSDFFDYFAESEADLISSYVRTYSAEPNFHWWNLNHPTKEIQLEHRVRSFNPIYRISARALDFLDKELKDGWCGHHEVILPTLVDQNDRLQLTDFNADNKFSGKKKSFYTSSTDSNGKITSGTMRYIPATNSAGLRPGKLYHPVKESGIGKFRFILGNLYRKLNNSLKKKRESRK